MRKHLIWVLSILTAALLSVGAALWIILYQTSSPYPTELSGTFTLHVETPDDFFTAQNGQIKGDLIKAGVVTGNTSVTKIIVEHDPDNNPETENYFYEVQQSYTNVSDAQSLKNTTFTYGVAAAKTSDARTLDKITENHSSTNCSACLMRSCSSLAS